MSEPTQAPDVPGPKAPAPAAPRRARPWTDTVMLLALTAAVTIVAVAAVPSVLRLTKLPGLGTHPPSGLARLHPGSSSAPHPLVFDDHADDDGDPVDDLEKLYPDPSNWPGKRDTAPDGAEDDGVPKAPDDVFSHGARVGLARKTLMLVDRAAPDAHVLGEVRAGEVIMIVKEQGDWALVVHSGGDDVSMGWTRKSDIAVR